MKLAKIDRTEGAAARIMEFMVCALYGLVLWMVEGPVEAILRRWRGGEDYAARRRAEALRQLISKEGRYHQDRRLERRLVEQFPDLRDGRIK